MGYFRNTVTAKKRETVSNNFDSIADSQFLTMTVPQVRFFGRIVEINKAAQIVHEVQIGAIYHQTIV